MVIAVVATVAWHLLITGESNQKPMVTVPVAAQNIPSMTVIEQQHLLLVEMPEEEVDKLNIIKEQSEILGKRIFEAMEQNSPFLKSNIQMEDAQAPFYLPTGYRAITITNSSLIGVAGFARPGMYVDIFWTFEGEYADKKKFRRTSVAFQNVKVIAVNEEGTPDEEGNTLNTITLMMNVNDAKHLTLMEESGKMKLVLRPSSNDPIVPVEPPTVPANPLPPAEVPIIN